jgi:arginyl-tRNA--protein-N-Asp/Glu arginylyltransferase
LGYWVDACPAMNYKVSYRVHEILHPDNVWRRGQPDE